MIDDWWLMSDEWWLMIDDKINTNIIWNGPILFAPGGDPPWGKLYLTFHIISVINHQSSIISHQSSIINHQSSMINDQSIVSTHQSSIFSRHAVITFFLTCMQRREHSLGTFGHHRRASGILGNLGKPSVTVGNRWKPSVWQIFYTFSLRNRSGIGFMRSRSVEPKQKPEIFHCYNGSGGSSRGADGVYREKT